MLLCSLPQGCMIRAFLLIQCDHAHSPKSHNFIVTYAKNATVITQITNSVTMDTYTRRTLAALL